MINKSNEELLDIILEYRELIAEDPENKKYSIKYINLIMKELNDRLHNN